MLHPEDTPPSYGTEPKESSAKVRHLSDKWVPSNGSMTLSGYLKKDRATNISPTKEKPWLGSVSMDTTSTLSSSSEDEPTKEDESIEETKDQRQVNEFKSSMTVGIDESSSPEAHSAAIAKRIAILEGSLDARSILPLWRENAYVHEMFEFWVKVQPQALALEVWQEPDICQASLSYKELNTMADNVALLLLQISHGKTVNRVVVIHIPRSVELVVAILAVAKAGMAFAAVDTEELPLERLHYILHDTKSGILLTTHHEKESPVGSYGVCRVYVEDIMNSRSSNHDCITSIDRTLTDDNDLLALVYTSGSTGKPKGVMLNHGAYANYHAVEQRIAGVTPDDRVVHTQSISFVSGVGEVFRALCGGATLLMCGAQVRRQGPDLLTWLESKKVTVFKAVPSMLRGLIAPKPPNLDSLRLVISSGEACTKDIVDFFTPSVALINSYGPTETCSNNMFKVCRQSEEITIGRPYPTFRIHLLDENFNENHKFGEICVWGLSVAMGYLNVDSGAFFDHPTLGRLYRTGDMGEMVENGEIRYAGRTDHQVKIKGYRIELGEIESKFQKLAFVAEAAVVHADGRLYGFVTLDKSLSESNDVSTFSLGQWRDALLRSGLGAYALPHSVTIIETMPRVVSGKIDRKQLPLPSSVAPKDPDNTDSIDPRTSSTNSILLAVFARVLGLTIASCNGDMNFFEHGGDSSSAGIFVSQLRGISPRFQKVSVKDLYLNPTPNGLRRVIGDDTEVNEIYGTEAVGESEPADGDTTTKESTRWTPQSDSEQTNKCNGESVFFTYHGKLVGLGQLLYFLFACLMDGAAVRVGIWCLLFSRVWLFSLIGIDAQEWGFGIDQPLKMISLHAVLLFSLFYVVIWMWFGIWFVLLLLTKWSLVGIYTPGLKTSQSWFIRNWIVGRIAMRIPWSSVYGNPLGNCMLSMLGAKIGKRAYLAIDSRAPIIGGFDCIEVGDNACINHAFVSAISMSPLGVDVGYIRVLDRAVVHPRATLVGGTTLSPDSQLGCLSNLATGSTIPSGEFWGGSPVSYSHEIGPAVSEADLRGKNLGYTGYHIVRNVYNFLVHLSIGMPLTFTTAVLLFLTNGWWTTMVFIFFILFHIPWAVLIMVVVPALYINAINWLNDLSAGDYHLYCWQAMMISVKQGLFAIPQGLLNNTYFLVDWMRWCGAKIGPRSELARVRGAVPDMLDLGEETFLANWTHVATPEIVGNLLRVGKVKVGNKFLAGNRAVIPINTTLGEDVLLGVLSLAPTNTADTDFKTWIGNPSFPISHVPSGDYPTPTGWEAEMRRVWDIIAICVPLTLLGAMSISWFLLAALLHDYDDIFPKVVHSAAVGFVLRILFSFLTAKWLYWYFENGAKPSMQEYWSEFNHRWHIYSKTWATFIRPTLLLDIEGSWYLNKFFTMCTDMKIGQGTHISAADAFREHDLVRIGKNSVINTFGEIRTHTFEDWKLKLNEITIGNYCTIGHSSTLMANSRTLDYVEVGANTFVMKNEELGKDIEFSGLPGVPVGKSRTALARDHGLPRAETDEGEEAFPIHWIAMVIFAACLAAVVVPIVLSKDAQDESVRHLRTGVNLEG